ncbi:hypothetical protein [Borreliella lusitaniae]
MTKFRKQPNIIGSIITMIVISISGLGTYAFKGILDDLKNSVLKVKVNSF